MLIFGECFILHLSQSFIVGKPYLLNSKRHLRKSPAGSDEDGERKTTRSSSLSGTSEVRCELQRSESVSTNESDTFDVIPCRRRSPAEVMKTYLIPCSFDATKYDAMRCN